MISAGEQAQKIGITRSHPARRLSALQTAHHSQLRLAGFWRVSGADARRIEHEAHGLLRESRAAGEWFSVSVQAALAAVEVVTGAPSVRSEPSLDAIRTTIRTIRAARMMVGWSAQELATASGVGVATIRRAEGKIGDAGLTAPIEAALRRALEGVGVVFLDENGGGPGVRLRKATE